MWSVMIIWQNGYHAFWGTRKKFVPSKLFKRQIRAVFPGVFWTKSVQIDLKCFSSNQVLICFWSCLPLMKINHRRTLHSKPLTFSFFELHFIWRFLNLFHMHYVFLFEMLMVFLLYLNISIFWLIIERMLFFFIRSVGHPGNDQRK